MPVETIHVRRQDIIRGDVPQEAAAACRNNVPLVLTDGGTTIQYRPVEYCAGATHPDEPWHPWRWLPTVPVSEIETRYRREDQWREVPRKARIRYAEVDEELRLLEGEGLTRTEALSILAERHKGEIFATSEDAI